MTNLQKLLVSTTAGILAGVTIGLLLAPEKGSDTRRKIADGANNLAGKLRRKKQQLEDEISEYENQHSYS